MSVVVPFVDAPVWVPEDSNFLALHHYKMPIPYILKAGSVVELNANRSCTICVLNNNRNTETIAENVTGNRSFEIAVDSVVFVNCIAVDNSDATYRVTYSIQGDFEVLPHVVCGNNAYTAGVDETASYAFVEGDDMQLLVPRADLGFLNAMIGRDAQLFELNSFYSDVVALYDDLAGIAFKRKYFAKADINGVQTAQQYAKFYMAETGPSMSKFYLNTGPGNWGCLHEMARSFDAYFTRNTIQVDLYEVWANIFADYYQYMKFSAEEYASSAWMLGVDAESVLKSLANIFSTVRINLWTARQRSIFLTSFFYKIGHRRLMRSLYGAMIDQINNGTFEMLELKVFDLIIQEFYRDKIDVVYVNQLARVLALDDVLTQTVLNDTACSVYVYEFMLRPDTVSFNLVHSVDDVQRDALLEFKNVNASDMLGGQYSLVNSETNSFTATFTNSRVKALSMPVGCYKFLCDTGNGPRRHFCATQYVIFDGETVKPAVDITPYERSSLLNEKFIFLAIAESLAAILQVNFRAKQYRFDRTSERPHYVFANDVYCSVEIENEVLWRVMGIDNTLGMLEYPMQIGQKLTLYHREPSRLVSAFDTQNSVNEFVVTQHGLKSVDDANSASSTLFSKLVNFCSRITAEFPLLLGSSFIQDTVYLAYKSLPVDDQTELGATVVPFLPDTSVTSLTALGAHDSNMLRVRERNGILYIATFNNSAPQNHLEFSLTRSGQRIFSLVVNRNQAIYASELSVRLENNDIIYMEMGTTDNRRFIVIDGVLQKPASRRLYYQWKNGTLSPVQVTEPVKNLTPLLLMVVAFIIFLVFFVCKCMFKEAAVPLAPTPAPAKPTKRPTNMVKTTLTKPIEALPPLTPSNYNTSGGRVR